MIEGIYKYKYGVLYKIKSRDNHSNLRYETVVIRPI